MNQCDQVLDYMRAHGTINCSQAFRELGVAALHSRVNDLRGRGYDIQREQDAYYDRDGKLRRGWKYRIADEPEEAAT